MYRPRGTPPPLKAWQPTPLGSLKEHRYPRSACGVCASSRSPEYSRVSSNHTSGFSSCRMSVSAGRFSGALSSCRRAGPNRTKATITLAGMNRTAGSQPCSSTVSSTGTISFRRPGSDGRAARQDFTTSPYSILRNIRYWQAKAQGRVFSRLEAGKREWRPSGPRRPTRCTCGVTRLTPGRTISSYSSSTLPSRHRSNPPRVVLVLAERSSARRGRGCGDLSEIISRMNRSAGTSFNEEDPKWGDASRPIFPKVRDPSSLPVPVAQ
eukprot:scaffold5584_cov110-Isochrysis_galbana.AAC.8